MRPFTSLFLHLHLLLLLLSYAPLRLSSTTHNRRILHQPFFPEDSPPPTPPPTPSPPSSSTPPKYPFSGYTPPDGSFFPSYPSPPPPPSPSSVASFPANISSLNLPHPPKSNSVSSKLIGGAVAAVVAAIIVASVAVFLHVKKRRKNRAFSDTKTSRSDNSTRYNYPNNVAGNAASNNGAIPKLTRPSQTSSEFLYLGTLVNSHHVGLERHTSSQQNARSDNANTAVNPRKMDSPELRPLPPLNGRRNEGNGEMGRGRDEESEEFYSPRGSVGGRDSSIGAGSASRRAFAAVEVANFNRSSSSSSLYSSSSSGSGSPARSVSLSISPPVSASPKHSRPKSPELVAVQLQIDPPVAPTSPPPPPLPSPQRPAFTVPNKDSLSVSPNSFSPDRNSRSGYSSPQISHGSDRNEEPPVRISSPVKQDVLVFNPYSRFVNVSNQNVESPEMISSPVKQNEHVFYPYSRTLNVSDQNVESPERINRPVKQNAPILELDSGISDVSDQDLESPERITSPVKQSTPILELDSGISDVSDQDLESPERFTRPVKQNAPIFEPDSGISDVLDQNVESPAKISSPANHNTSNFDPILQNSDVSDEDVESPERITSQVKQDTPLIPSVILPPPILVPPPPPPPPPSKYWESPRTPTPPIRKPLSQPPVLITPLGPMLIESPTLISPMQLPTHLENGDKNEESEKNEETPKPKLKALHWDKVRASSDREMVWDQLRSSSFKLNEEMIETLFIVNTPKPTPKEATRRQILPLPTQENRVLDPKKSQNIAILLKALHVTVDEVCEALLEGNTDTLGTDLLESLLKMAPTKDEELKLKEHKDDSPVKLGPAEKFLKAVVDIPFAFKRIDALLYTSTFDSEVEYLKKSFETLEAACEELRNSRMFLKLLEAVLKTGNRMNVGTNRGDAHAFKLDTLLKLIDVKGADGKTTLLHFVVQEIIRSEGARLSAPNQNQTPAISDDIKCRKLGLQVVSALGSELTNVKKAAAMDSEVLNSDVLKLAKGLEKIAEVVRLNEVTGSEQRSSHKFSESMSVFMKMAEEEIIRLQAQESVSLTLVKEITEYFHGNSAKEEAHPFRIFMVVRDFLSVLDRVCKEVGMINERTVVSSAHKFPVPVNPMLQPVSTIFPGRRQYSSSDDDSSPP